MTATGSRPCRSRVWPTVNVAEISNESSTRPSPGTDAPPPWPPVTRPTPASDTPNPAQATGRATACCQTAAITATSTGTAPMSSAAWVTLVRATPAFCSTTDAPYPAAPDTSTSGVAARRVAGTGRAAPARVLRPAWARARFRRTRTSRIAAARPNRATVSQPAGSQARASLDSGTVVPHSIPATARAATARRRLVVMLSGCQPLMHSWSTNVVS